MGTVTAYDMASIQSALGGSNPISLSEYYRGGAYVPTTRSTVVNEGPFFSQSNPLYFWQTASVNNYAYAYCYWAGTYLGAFYVGNGGTSFTSGSYTYYRGSFYNTSSDAYGNSYPNYGIRRTSGSSVSINTGVPSSGTISISQLYGAANP